MYFHRLHREGVLKSKGGINMPLTASARILTHVLIARFHRPTLLLLRGKQYQTETSSNNPRADSCRSQTRYFFLFPQCVAAQRHLLGPRLQTEEEQRERKLQRHNYC